ncbi:peptide deformylase [Rickettsia endosymbiont of Rhinocyllus conicus]|uniref:peptide deformylase n=1 Tax=Rickettsia endosymbiont of Rhinocyllus conicus TaxID=3066252 RepID=UPI0031330727
MPILKIIKTPNSLLRIKSLPVTIIDSQMKDFMKSMLETMYNEEGIGISAIQVGKPIRALIVDIPKEENDQIKREPFFIINPEVNYLSEEKVILNEDCLSIRKEDGIAFIIGDVERPKNISISYIDLEGNSKELTCNGNNSDYDLWFSRCLQHELDHLDGILFIDRLYNAKFTKTEIEISGNLQTENI